MTQRIMIAAWGSRGDLQPVTALAVALKKRGRDVLVFATPPATDLLKEHNIDCIMAKENIAQVLESMFGQVDLSDRSIGGLIRLAKFGKAFLNSPDYVETQKSDMIKAIEAAKRFKPDMLIVPNILYGPYMSIAELMGSSLITYDLQVNHPTSELPLFTMEVGKLPAFLNRSLYRFKAWLYPKMMKPKFDMMRELCGLPINNHSDGSKFKAWPHQFPQVCAVSPSLCPQPSDWPRQKIMSGWWFLDSKHGYSPQTELIEFMKFKPVYIGFGSMKSNAEFCTMLSTLAIKSLYIAGVKGVLLGGWAGLTRESLDQSTPEGKLLYTWSKENVFEVDACPHDWLFPQCSAVVHHGGAGTLAAGIKAGRPTIVCATQGDQPFHGSLVQKQGIGKYLGMIGSDKVTAEAIAQGIKEVTQDPLIIKAADEMSKKVQHDDGVMATIHFIEDVGESFQYPWPIHKITSQASRTA